MGTYSSFLIISSISLVKPPKKKTKKQKQKKRKVEKVLEREKIKDEVVAEERRLTGLDRCSGIARQYQGSFVKDSHKAKVRPVNMCFSPFTINCLVCM